MSVPCVEATFAIVNHDSQEAAEKDRKEVSEWIDLILFLFWQSNRVPSSYRLFNPLLKFVRETIVPKKMRRHLGIQSNVQVLQEEDGTWSALALARISTITEGQ